MQEEYKRSQQNSTSSEQSSSEDDKSNDSPSNSNQDSKSSESVIDYAKNTMNSLLSMYGYEERITTESLKSNIKSEPLSPTANESLQTRADSPLKSDESSKQNSKPRTATVLPMPSTSPESKRKMSEGSGVRVSSTSHDQPVSSKRSGLPSKPITSYMRYRNMIFEEIKHKYPGCSPYDLATLISSKWSKLTDSERKVWEDQYEDDMKDYNENVNKYYNIPTAAKRDWMQEKKTPANLLTFVENISLRIEPQSPAQQLAQSKSSKLSPSTPSSSQEQSNTKTSVSAPPPSGLCHWCKRWSILQDFSTIIEGREIYCTGLCSDKCFTEASKQICNVESGSIKPRYVKSSSTSRALSSSSSSSPFIKDDSRYQSASISESSSTLTVSKSGDFNWDQYLADTQSTAAPWMYFKQARDHPPNFFTVGMKLEALCSRVDQYLPLIHSLATVVAVSGPRIMLHFDGAGTSTDVWKLPDSSDIHPVGWTEGTKLRPPRGYKYDVAQYSNFYASSLQNADIAPARFFKKEPKSPLENYFTVGMKLEAVNRQNPSAIGIATVTNVEGDQIRIELDGLKGLGYWCIYTDRDLFPAGWCAAASHPLQTPPGMKSNAVERIVPRAKQGASTPPLASLSSSETRSQSSSPFRSSSTVATIRESESQRANWKEKSTSPNNVEVFINSECYCGPYVNKSKFELVPRVFRGPIVNVLKNVLEDTIKSANDPKTVFGFLKPGRGNCVIMAVCDGVTYQCCLNSIDRVSKFWTVLEQFSDNLRCCTNLFSSTELHAACSRCTNNRVGTLPTNPTMKRTAIQSYPGPHRPNYTTSGRNRPVAASNSVPYDYYKTSHRQEKSYDASSYSMVGYHSPRSDNVPTGRHTLARNDSVFERSRQDSSLDVGKTRQTSNDDEIGLYDSEKEDVNVDDFDEPVTKKRKLQKNLAGGVEVSTAPKSWSIDDVINFIDQTDLKESKEKFKENEIDGKALLLLQRDLVLSHMGFKLGPAVKLLDLIEELKVVQKNLT